MPPPATPNSKMRHLPSQRINSSAKRDSNDPVYDDDAISFVSTTMTKQKLDPLDIDAMEGARRHAAAVSLPANSGIWSQTERELYFHLAYRGFELYFHKIGRLILRLCHSVCLRTRIRPTQH